MDAEPQRHRSTANFYTDLPDTLAASGWSVTSATHYISGSDSVPSLGRFHPQRKLLKLGGRQRVDSSRVVAAVCEANRLELLTESVRAALASIVAATPE